MFETYTMQLMSWWLLFGVTVIAGIAVSEDNDDNNVTPAPQPEPPEPNPDLAPFTQFSDFDPALYSSIQVGTAENDTIILPDATSGALAGLGGDDSLDGSNTADYLVGGEGNDTIFGRLDSDIIRGGGGDDSIQAGWQNDYVTGGTGNDTIDGLYGEDVLRGGIGDDVITGFAGSDQLMGGVGNDTLNGYDLDRVIRPGAAQPDGTDTLDGGEGNDEIWLSGSDVGIGGNGADRFISDVRSEADTRPATINDYDSAEDQLFVIVPEPAEGAALPEITQSVSQNGEDRLILMDGVEIARVVGAGQGAELDVTTITEAPQAPNSPAKG